MKRSDMLKLIEELLCEIKDDPASYMDEDAEFVLSSLEKAGMRPPVLDSKRYNALSYVYVYPDPYIWQEDFEKDERVLEAYNRPKHNHVTRDVKPLGKCPACDYYRTKDASTALKDD